jgi:hypothetical protein
MAPDSPDNNKSWGEVIITKGGYPLEALWPDAIKGDEEYGAALKAVQEGKRKFPADLHLKVLIAECAVTNAEKLTFQNRIWVPLGLDLRMKVLQEIHNSMIYVYPGREVMFATVARQFY